MIKQGYGMKKYEADLKHQTLVELPNNSLYNHVCTPGKAALVH